MASKHRTMRTVILVLAMAPGRAITAPPIMDRAIMASVTPKPTRFWRRPVLPPRVNTAPITRDRFLLPCIPEATANCRHCYSLHFLDRNRYESRKVCLTRCHRSLSARFNLLFSTSTATALYACSKQSPIVQASLKQFSPLAGHEMALERIPFPFRVRNHRNCTSADSDTDDNPACQPYSN
jgi:hypothetical protein